jgi:hypothetical protein
MATTIIHEQRETRCDSALARGDELWLDAAAVEETTGWAWKPEGLCRGEICMPLPRQGRSAALVQGERLNLAAAWRGWGRPVVHDAEGSTWVLGTDAQERSAALASGVAPDFELPDLDGRLHRLSEHRGRKVFLATWASW